MNKEFAPYEESLELKQLGFDEPCFTWYWDDIGLYNGLEYSNHNKREHVVSAPTFSQTFRWFREKHDLLNDVGISANRKNDTKKWMYSIIYLDKNTYIYSEETYNTYEEAELACLKKLIEIVKNKN
jgi:hypothetical protein